MRLGLLTGGGDCPGLNAAIRAVVCRAAERKITICGILEGWKGLLTSSFRPLAIDSISGILPLGGTILGTSRTNPLKSSAMRRKVIRNFKKTSLDGILAIGGEGTMRIAYSFQKAGVPIIGIPKTIDNDLWGTDVTIGFNTAVQIVTDAIDRLRTTAESHHRVMIVEVMGRHTGWIAVSSGIAGGAEAILIPESPFPLSRLIDLLQKRKERGKNFSIVVVSEDARLVIGKKGKIQTPVKHDEYGDIKLGGIGQLIARELRKKSSFEVRVTELGHLQRGGTPTAFDRILATRLGVEAVDLAAKKKFGRMVGLQGNKIISTPLTQIVPRLKKVDRSLYRLSETFFG
ncbi:MAG: ATP-dependent 6-phosphofructokinase [Deltaproteobacteria bacterium]|nr:ATP-dependent 6-phosphofructokinase [Deltaproteobacteria bacterium]